jgi:hypothetical protein
MKQYTVPKNAKVQLQYNIWSALNPTNILARNIFLAWGKYL